MCRAKTALTSLDLAHASRLGAAAKKGKGGVSSQTRSRGKKRKANEDVDALTGFPRDPDDSKKYVEAGISLVERLMGYSGRKNTQA
ncbi:hypothetical protein SLS61_007301 [Didymella pomorum]